MNDMEKGIQIERFNTLHQLGEWLEKQCPKPLPDSLLNDFHPIVTGKDILSLKDGILPKKA